MAPVAESPSGSPRALGNGREALLALLIIFTPLARGTVEVWAVTLVCCVAIAVAALELTTMLRVGRIRLRRTPLDLPTGLFLTLACLSAWFSVYPYASRIQLYRLFVYAVVFKALVNRRGHRRELLRLVWLIVLFGGLYATAGLTMGEGRFLGFRSFSDGDYGISLTFVNPNHFAGYLGMVTWLGVGLALSGGGAKRVLCLALAIYMAVAALFSLSRGGACGLAAGFTFFLFAAAQGCNRRRNLLLICAFLGLVLVVASGLGIGPVLDRLDTLRTPLVTGEARIEFWRGALGMIAARPWLGSGPGTYVWASGSYQTERSAGFVINHAHNDYVELAAEIGLVGLAAGLWGLGVLLFGGLQRVRAEEDRQLQAIGLGALAACVGLLVHAGVEFNAHIPANALLFVVCAALVFGASPGSGRREYWVDFRPGQRWRKGGLVGLGLLSTVALVAVVSPLLGSFFSARARSDHAAANWDLGAANLRRAIALDPGNAGHLVQFGDLWLARIAESAVAGELQTEEALGQALALYEAAIARCPLRSYYHAKRASVLKRLGRVVEAGAELEMAAELAPMLAVTHYHLGRHHLEQGARGRGYGELRRFLELDRRHLTMVLDLLWKTGPSLTVLRKVVPPGPEAWGAYARYLHDKGEAGPASAELAFAFALQPTLDNAVDQLRCLRSWKRYSAALEVAQRHLERFGEQPSLQLEKAEILSALGRHPEAVGICETVFDSGPGDLASYLRLGTLWQRAGRPADTVRVLQQGLAEFSAEPGLHFALALAFRAQGLAEEELAALKRAVGLRPRGARYRHQLGQAYRNRGLYQLALDQWQRCLEADPDHTGCRRAKERLLAELGND